MKKEAVFQPPCVNAPSFNNVSILVTLWIWIVLASLSRSLTHGGMTLYEKLDRIFSNASWRILYPEAHVKVLHMFEFSDHHHVLLTLVDKDFCKIPKSFKFECAWLVEDNIDHMLNAAWNKNQSLLSNLDCLKVSSLNWKLQNIGSIRKDKVILISRI